MSIIEAKPTKGLTYSPMDPHYFDEEMLQLELTRGLDICNGCRMCFNLCPSFPALFKFADARDQDVRKLTPAELDHVIDTCFQCKICYVKCPYTPDDKHEFQLDYPRLLARAKAVRNRKKGIPIRERMLSNPDLIGRLTAPAAWLANFMNRLPPMRWVMELLGGIHRRKLLPDFHGRSFMVRYKHMKRTLDLGGDNGKVLYFPTCFVNYNAPEIGEAALRVFSRNRLTVEADYGNCCGMPALDSGDVAQAQRLARANIERLLPWVREGYAILVNNPTCSMMMRKEYPGLVGGKDAEELAAAVKDPNEYLNEMRREGRLNTDFKSTPGLIRYHVPCHLRAQNIGYRSRDMMRAISEVAEVELTAECCGHDGTWAMKKEYFEESLVYGKKAFDGLRGEADAPAGIMATDCPLAAIQFQQALGTRPLHPLQVLDRAYEPDGFPTAVPPKPKD